jgi:hypothetical protein
MAELCRRCTKSILGECPTYYKTDEQLKQEKFPCFSERVYHIDKKHYSPDDEFNIYGNEINKLNEINRVNRIRRGKLEPTRLH